MLAEVVMVPSVPMASVGNALTGRVGFVDGHEVMKADAIEYTSSRSRGVSSGPDHGVPLSTADESQAW